MAYRSPTRSPLADMAEKQAFMRGMADGPLPQQQAAPSAGRSTRSAQAANQAGGMAFSPSAGRVSPLTTNKKLSTRKLKGV